MPRADVPRPSAAPALGLLAALCAVALVVLFAVAVHTAAGQRLDDAARGGETLYDHPRAAQATERLLATISVSSLAFVGAIIVGLALARRRPALALGALVVVAGANLTTQAMKHLLDRPGLAGDGVREHGSFPSGHVTVATSLGMALVLVAPPAVRSLAALAGWAYASAVSGAVIALDWHRPSEALAGQLCAVGWAAAVAAVLVATDRLGDGGMRLTPRLRALAVALVLGFAAVVAVTAAQRVDLVRLVDDRTRLAAGIVACAATCALLTGSLTALLLRADAGTGPRRRPDR